MTGGAGEEPFPNNIEREWIRYIKWQEKRLSDAGEVYPHVSLFRDGEGRAKGVLCPDGDEAVSPLGLNAAVEIRLKHLAKNPDRKERERKAKIAKLRAEIAQLEGGEQ